MTTQDWQDAERLYNDCIGGAGGFPSSDPASCEAVVQSYYPEFSANAGGGFGQSMTTYWSDPGNWIDFTQGLANIGGTVVSWFDPNATPTTPTSPPQQENNTVWWVVGIAVFLILLMFLYLILKK